MYAIECDAVVKAFGATRALDGLDLQVRAGEVHGFVGPNGAGKTVTMRIVLGLYRHDAGQVRVLGGDPWHDAVALHRRMAYVPGDTSLWPTLTGGEIIDVLGGLRGGIDPVRRVELLERFDLDPTKKARTYSKGNRQKVALVAALASDAELFILDEPTSGLDPLVETVFQQLIAELRDEGRSILLSSHILAEVEQVCDRVTIIRRGRAVESGSLDELRLLTRTTITAEVSGDPEGLLAMEGVHNARREGDTVTFEVDSAQLAGVLQALGELGARSLASHPPTLEELFLRHYGDELTQHGVNGVTPRSSSRRRR